MIAGGLVWVTNSGGTLFGLDPTAGTARSQFAIPEKTISGGSDVNHFATPSAGGGRLFVGSGDQVTAFTIAQPPPPTATNTTLVASPTFTRAGGAVTLTATVAPTPDGGTITFTDGATAIAGCPNASAATGGQVTCQTTFARPGTHTLVASYSGDAFYAASTSGSLAELVTGAVPMLTKLHLSSHRVSVAGRRVHGRCVKATENNRRHAMCRRPMRLRITYSLDTPATVKLTFKRHATGRKVHGRCVKPTKKNRKRAPCTRLVTIAGSITVHGRPGRNAFKLGRRRLGPGTYQLTTRPSANGRAGSPQRATFTVVG